MNRSSLVPPGAASSMLSARLASHAIEFDARRLPPSVVHATERAILDGLGVMLAASGSSPDVRPFFEWVQAQPGPPQAALLGFNSRAGAPQAALLNGAMAHALDYEDAFDLAPLHPNASLLPAALATLESRAYPCAGRQFLAAVALGCDLVCRMGLSLRRPLEAGGWYPPPILGAFGATLAAARLARLDSRQLCDAWSLLLAQNSCPGEIKFSPESTMRAVREAFPAQAAVISMELAARGVRGFDAPLEGQAAFYALFAGGEYDPQPLLEALGERFWIEQLSFKPWPCCRGTHAYIEAAQYLRRGHDFRPEDIEGIVCIGGSVQEMLAQPPARKRSPQTIIDAKFSIPFTVAVALSHPEVTLGSFTPVALRDPDLLSLAARCEFQLDRHARFSHAAAGALRLLLRDGRTLHHTVDRALGEPARPMSDTALREKFIDCASRAATPVEPERAARCADRILALDGEPDVAGMLRSLHGM
ncbi:MAG: MmgE/PrpD family protein [Acetobacteraceae bacterium]